MGPLEDFGFSSSMEKIKGLSFVGPFPISDKRKETVYDTCNAKGITELSHFVKYIAENSEIRTSGRYTDAEIKEHTQYVEDFVRYISVNVGKLKSIFQSKMHIRRGSHYEKTKVVAMNEMDFLCVLRLTDGETVHVMNIDDENCNYYGLEYGYINVTAEVFPLEELEITTNGSKLSVNIIHELKKAVEVVLKQSTVYQYKEDEIDPIDESVKNPVGSCSVSSVLHGPCIMLTLVTPHSTTDIDLCFCVEKKLSDLGRCVMIPNMKDSCMCSLKHCHWILSVVDPANINHVLSWRHKRVYICIKGIMFLMAKTRVHPITVTSYILKMHILHHQQTCRSATVGECFQEIVLQLMLLLRNHNANGLRLTNKFNKSQRIPLDKWRFITEMDWRRYNDILPGEDENTESQNVDDDPNTIHASLFEGRVRITMTDLLVPAKQLNYTLELSDATMFLVILQMVKYNASEWWLPWPKSIFYNSSFSRYGIFFLGALVHNKSEVVLKHDGNLKTRISIGPGPLHRGLSYVTVEYIFAALNVCSGVNVSSLLRFCFVFISHKLRQWISSRHQ